MFKKVFLCFLTVILLATTSSSLIEAEEVSAEEPINKTEFIIEQVDGHILQSYLEGDKFYISVDYAPFEVFMELVEDTATNFYNTVDEITTYSDANWNGWYWRRQAINYDARRSLGKTIISQAISNGIAAYFGFGFIIGVGAGTVADGVAGAIINSLIPEKGTIYYSREQRERRGCYMYKQLSSIIAYRNSNYTNYISIQHLNYKTIMEGDPYLPSSPPACRNVS